MKISKNQRISKNIIKKINSDFIYLGKRDGYYEFKRNYRGTIEKFGNIDEIKKYFDI